MQLTANFSLQEMLNSEYADKHGIGEQYKPTPDIVNALRALCVNTLQPLRDYIGEKYPGAIIRVNSGYRCPKVNKGIGGSSSSQHMQGEAADIVLIQRGTVRNDLLVQAIIDFKDKLVFDQLIYEYGASAKNPAWVHISYNSNGAQRRSQLRPQGKGYVAFKLF